MQFTLTNLDMAGGLANPIIVGTLVLCAILFAAAGLRILVSKRSALRKCVTLAALLAVSAPAGWLTEGLTQVTIAWLVARRSPGMEVGFMEHAPLMFVPLLTLALLGLSWLLRSAWKLGVMPRGH